MCFHVMGLHFDSMPLGSSIEGKQKGIFCSNLTIPQLYNIPFHTNFIPWPYVLSYLPSQNVFQNSCMCFSDCSSRARSCPWLVLQSVVLESLKFIFTQIITPICIGMKHDWKHVRDAEGKYVPGERKDSQGNSCSRKGGLMVRVNLYSVM